MTILPQSDKYNNATKISADGSDGSACNGDSGGPLFIRNRDGCGGVNYKQIGIVSHGKKCGAIHWFTRVNRFNDWIDEKLRRSQYTGPPKSLNTPYLPTRAP